MKINSKCWLALAAATLFCNQDVSAQVERLAYSFEGNGEEGRGENNFSFNKGYFPLSDDGNFLAQGRSGLALSDDLLAVGSIETFTVEKPLTGSVWFKPSNLEQTQSLLTRINPQDGRGIRLSVNREGHLQLHFTDRDGGVLAFSSDATIAVDNTWYHLAFTYKADLTEVQLYINGEVQELDTIADNLGGDINTAHPLIIGGDETLSPIQGGLDEVQIIPLYFSELNMLCLFRLEPDCAYQPTTATRGPRGFTGPRGPVGERGDRGPQGPTGDQGQQGATGAAGNPGAKGPKGNTGIQGPKGLQGPDGNDGIDGADGRDGDDGAMGPTGPKGDLGPQGEKGFTGPRGPQGDTGDRGPQGPKGYRGLKGIKGDTGARGDKGPRGDDGDVGAVGLKGVKGVKGVKGDRGAKGDPGGRGAQGDQGPKGPVGVIGYKGYRGDRGPQGPRGYSGCDTRNPYFNAYLCRDRVPYSDTGFVAVRGAFDEANYPVIDLSDYGIRSWKEAERLIAAVGKGPEHLARLIQETTRRQALTFDSSAQKDLRDLQDILLELDVMLRDSKGITEEKPQVKNSTKMLNSKLFSLPAGSLGTQREQK